MIMDRKNRVNHATVQLSGQYLNAEKNRNQGVLWADLEVNKQNLDQGNQGVLWNDLEKNEEEACRYESVDPKKEFSKVAKTILEESTPYDVVGLNSPKKPETSEVLVRNLKTWLGGYAGNQLSAETGLAYYAKEVADAYDAVMRATEDYNTLKNLKCVSVQYVNLAYVELHEAQNKLVKVVVEYNQACDLDTLEYSDDDEQVESYLVMDGRALEMSDGSRKTTAQVYEVSKDNEMSAVDTPQDLLVKDTGYEVVVSVDESGNQKTAMYHVAAEVLSGKKYYRDIEDMKVQSTALCDKHMELSDVSKSELWNETKKCECCQTLNSSEKNNKPKLVGALISLKK